MSAAFLFKISLKLRQEDHYTDAVESLIIKFSKAKAKKIKVKPERATLLSPVFCIG